LIIALILGLLAAKMALNLIASKQVATKPEVKHPQVVVAKQNIEAGEPLTEDNVELGDLSSDTVPDTLFRNVSDLAGRVATVPLVQGQFISTTLLAPKGASAGLTSVIPPGFRAMTMEINEFSGVAGFVQAGCHVDVILSMRNEQTGASMARTIVQDVKVAAVGMRHNPGDPPNTDAGHSVTVLVTPQQAEVLELASSAGHPRLALRNNNDLFPVQSAGVSFADIRGNGANGKADVVEKINVESQQKAAAIAAAAPVTSPAAVTTPTTRPVWVEMWTVKVIRGANESDQQFPVRDGPSDAGSPYNIDNGVPSGSAK